MKTTYKASAITLVCCLLALLAIAAGKRISDFTDATSIDNTNVIELDIGSASRKVSFGTLATNLATNGAFATSPLSSLVHNSNGVLRGSSKLLFTNGILKVSGAAGGMQVGDGSFYGGSITFSNEVGMYFTPSQTGPHYGAGIGGINYRTIVGETINEAFLLRGNAYVFENTGATWLMSLDAQGLNVGSAAGSAPPNVLSKFEVAGNAAIGSANARTVAAPSNGLRVQGKVQIGTVGDQDYGQVTISPSTSVNDLSTLVVGDTAQSTNRAGIYIRSTVPGTAGISSAGTPIVFYQGGPGVEETMRISRSVGLGILTNAPEAALHVHGSAALGVGNQPTNATTGFVYLATMTNAPLAVPVSIAGHVPMLVDTNAARLWLYVNGAWKYSQLN